MTDSWTIHSADPDLRPDDKRAFAERSVREVLDDPLTLARIEVLVETLA
jgi:hypothetical protein